MTQPRLSQREFRSLVPAVSAALHESDAIILHYLHRARSNRKSDGSEVTIADRKAERLLRGLLHAAWPEDAVFGEEYGGTLERRGRCWLLDPIDGTKSFIHHVPLFGTLVALERDGMPVVGVIACHAAGETISAAEGEGAWLNGARVRVSVVDRLADATVSMTSFKRMPHYYPAGFAGLCEHAGLLRAWGDCYGYLMVAAGRIEAMLDPVMNHWDVAALWPIVREAGGRLTTWEGQERVGESAIATNGMVHDELVQLLNSP